MSTDRLESTDRRCCGGPMRAHTVLYTVRVPLRLRSAVITTNNFNNQHSWTLLQPTTTRSVWKWWLQAYNVRLVPRPVCDQNSICHRHHRQVSLSLVLTSGFVRKPPTRSSPADLSAPRDSGHRPCPSIPSSSHIATTSFSSRTSIVRAILPGFCYNRSGESLVPYESLPCRWLVWRLFPPCADPCSSGPGHWRGSPVGPCHVPDPPGGFDIFFPL